MYLPLLVILLVTSTASAFDQDELDIFDLVEELGPDQNFYSYLELTEEATTNDIRKAYRRLSLVMHPDKNDAPDAGLKFRWLASIYEILKNPQLREVYNRVLVEGLPDWRSPVFYYRRMRKIGLMEGLAYLFVIFTVFQYCIYWAHYWERKFTLKVSRKYSSNYLTNFKYKQKHRFDGIFFTNIFRRILARKWLRNLLRKLKKLLENPMKNSKRCWMIMSVKF